VALRAFISLIAAIVAVAPYVMPFVKKLQGSKSGQNSVAPDARRTRNA